MFKSRTCVEATWEDAGAGAGESRRRRRDYIMTHDYGQITNSVVLLGVQVTDVRRGYLGGRRQIPAPVPAPAPGLHHDYGQITTSVVLLGVQVTDVRRGYLGGRRRRRLPHHDYGQITTSVVLLGVQVPAPAPAPGLHHDCGQITARSQPLCCHAWEVTRGQ